MPRSTACPACAADREHCHETLVVHATGVLECADAGCTAALVIHEWVVGCDDVSPTGCCGAAAAAGREERRRAA